MCEKSVSYQIKMNEQEYKNLVNACVLAGRLIKYSALREDDELLLGFSADDIKDIKEFIREILSKC
jgi:Holliday junction resolvasome RuvABC DNA-binding subunit